MPSNRITQRMDGVIIRETTTVIQQRYICMMHAWSGCNVICDDAEPDPYKKPKRGVCPADYQVLGNMVRDGLIKWEEAEDQGMCRPVKRQTQKRVLKAILARR